MATKIFLFSDFCSFHLQNFQASQIYRFSACIYEIGTKNIQSFVTVNVNFLELWCGKWIFLVKYSFPESLNMLLVLKSYKF
jgi:hypothetical protein